MVSPATKRSASSRHEGQTDTVSEISQDAAGALVEDAGNVEVEKVPIRKRRLQAR